MYVVIVMFFRWKFETDVRESFRRSIESAQKVGRRQERRKNSGLPDTCDAQPFGDIRLQRMNKKRVTI